MSPKTGRLLRPLQRFDARLRLVPPQLILLSLMFLGMLLTAGSFLLKLHSVQGPLPTGGGTRQVGYLSALNWMANLQLFFPLAAFYMFTALHSVPDTLHSLEAQGMLRNLRDRGKAQAAPLLAAWEQSRWRGWVLLLALVVGFGASLAEWVAYAAVPLATGNLEFIRPEVDWSVAAALHDRGPLARIANGAFAFAAFFMQGVMLALMVYFFLAMIELPMLLVRIEKYNLMIVPNLKETDRRRGFEVFEHVLHRMLFATFFTFLVLYLSRIQNLYYRSGAASIWEFVSVDVARGWTKGREGALPEGGLELPPGYPGAPGDIDFSSVAVIMGTLIMLALVLLIVAFTLSDVARQAYRKVSDSREAFARVFGLTPEEVKEKLDTMQTWPMRYPNFNMLLVVSLAAGAALIFYTFGLYAFGAALAAVAARTLGALVKYLTGETTDALAPGKEG